MSRDPRDLVERMGGATGRRAAHDQPLTSPPRPGPGPAPVAAAGPAYRQCSVHLTEELHRWARQEAAGLTANGAARITASEVIRLAMSRLQDDLAAKRLDLAAELAAQAHHEAQQYAGRRARNLPDHPGPSRGGTW